MPTAILLFFLVSFETCIPPIALTFFKATYGILCVMAMWNDGAKKGNGHNHADSVFYVLHVCAEN